MKNLGFLQRTEALIQPMAWDGDGGINAHVHPRICHRVMTMWQLIVGLSLPLCHSIPLSFNTSSSITLGVERYARASQMLYLVCGVPSFAIMFEHNFSLGRTLMIWNYEWTRPVIRPAQLTRDAISYQRKQTQTLKIEDSPGDSLW